MHITCSGGNEPCAVIWIDQGRAHVETFGCTCALRVPVEDLSEEERALMSSVVPPEILQHPAGFVIYAVDRWEVVPDRVLLIDGAGNEFSLDALLPTGGTDSVQWQGFGGVGGQIWIHEGQGVRRHLAGFGVDQQ